MKNVAVLVMLVLITFSMGVAGNQIAKPVAAVSANEVQTELETEPETEPETTGEVVTVVTEKETEKAEPIDEFISKMSIEEKVGQLFIVTPEAVMLNEKEQEDGAPVTVASGDMLARMAKYHIGGVIMFASNITDPEQITLLNSSIKNKSSIVPFICVDEEGGFISRIANNDAFDVPKYESMRDVGGSKDTESAKQVGVDIGTYLKEYGFNLNLAPVSDLDLGNAAIGSRAYSDNPTLTENMVKSEIEGFHSVGVMCCAKHFPGHGGATGDTHDGLADVEKNWDELLKNDLVPFKGAIDANIDMIMVGHLLTSQITNDGLPASLSKQMITDKLRGELGYNGVVITDSFAMGAITNNYTSVEAAVGALKAGADIVLMPKSLDEAYAAVLDAVESGEISEAQINTHLKRVLTLKEKYGLVEFE